MAEGAAVWLINLMRILKRIIERMQSSLYITDPVTHDPLYQMDISKMRFIVKKPEGKYCWDSKQKGRNLQFLLQNTDLYNKELGEAMSGGEQ